MAGIQIEKRRRKPRLKRKKTLKKALLLLAIIFIITLIGFSLVKNIKAQVDNWLVKVNTLELGQIMKTVPMEGLLIKTETVIYAPAAGEVELTIAEGQRTATGNIIGTVSGGYDTGFTSQNQHVMHAPVAGLVSFQIDGLEILLTSDSYKTLELTKLPMEEAAEPTLTGMVEKGQPIAKVINNLLPMGLVVPFSNSDQPDVVDIINSLEQGQTLELKVGDSSVGLLSAQLLETKVSQEQGMLILQLDGFVEELLNRRQIQFELVTERYQGLVVKQQAIIYEYEEPGLLILANDDSVKWQPVEIVGQIDQQLVITGLQQGIKYVQNPDR